MGMYTGLRGKVVFKSEELAAEYKFLLESDSCFEEWAALSNMYPEHKQLRYFSQLPRASCIPRGQVCYLDWEEAYWQIRGKVFEFCSSLKNYSGEIETFVEKVLPEIAEDWDLEMQYEEWLEPIKVTKEGGIDTDSIKFYEDV